MYARTSTAKALSLSLKEIGQKCLWSHTVSEKGRKLLLREGRIACCEHRSLVFLSHNEQVSCACDAQVCYLLFFESLRVICPFYQLLFSSLSWGCLFDGNVGQARSFARQEAEAGKSHFLAICCGLCNESSKVRSTAAYICVGGVGCVIRESAAVIHTAKQE